MTVTTVWLLSQSGSRGRACKLYIPYFKLNIRKIFFSVGVIDVWILLLANIFHYRTAETFNNHLVLCLVCGCIRHVLRAPPGPPSAFFVRPWGMANTTRRWLGCCWKWPGHWGRAHKRHFQDGGGVAVQMCDMWLYLQCRRFPGAQLCW